MLQQLSHCAQKLSESVEVYAICETFDRSQLRDILEKHGLLGESGLHLYINEISILRWLVFDVRKMNNYYQGTRRN